MGAIAMTDTEDLKERREQSALLFQRCVVVPKELAVAATSHFTVF
jgi:hypothetical protein